MIGYMKHAFWLLVRPILHPFWAVRKQSEEERKKELERYKHQQDAALKELKIEILLAHRQGVRDAVRSSQQAGEERGNER